MKLIVRDRTYRDFLLSHPHVSKEDLEYLLKNSEALIPQPYCEYEKPVVKTISDFYRLNMPAGYGFVLEEDLARDYGVTRIIRLHPDEDGIIYETFA